MRFLSRLPLGTRLSALAIATLLPLAILLVFSHLSDRDERRQAGLAQANAYTRNLGSAFEGAARDIDSYMSAAALVIGSQPDTVTHANTSPYLRGLMARYNNLNSLFITDLEGRVVAQAQGEDPDFDVRNRPYLQALMGGAERVWTSQIALRSGELIAAYGRVVPSRDGTPRAFLIASFKPTDALGNLPKDFPSDANLFIIDQNGQLIFSAHEPEVSKQPRDVKADPLVANAIRGDFVDIKGSETPFDTGRRYGAIFPVRQMNWAIGYTRSQSVLDAQVQERLLRDLGILFAIMTVTVAVLIFMARHMVRPLAKLAAAATEIAGGRRVEVALSGADPDVRQLERAFASMNTAVAEREDQLREQARVLSTLEQVGAKLASDLDFATTVKAVTDAGTDLTEAQFGAFFYNVKDDQGESYQLYTLSGVDPAAFEGFPMPRNTEVFASTFSGGVLRLDDVTQDSRYGKNEPYNGMPRGHLPVRSYLAVPVFGSHNEVIGGLFFGHPQPARFTDHHETLAMGIAAWASIALDNARLYQEAQDVQEELRKSNAAKDEFLGLVSHELRTPTTTIYGGIRMLDSRRDLLGPDATNELIHTMSEETERLVRLIENLLVFARLELGRMPDREPIIVNHVAEGVISTFSRSHRRRPIETSFAEGLPPVRGHAPSIEQVLTNFLSNADKYSPAGEPVTVATRLVDNDVQVLVTDRGPGVTPEELPQIFESFYRSPNASKVATGHGMGLSVSKRIMDAHEGKVFARNLAGGGFEIGFSLPVAAVTSEADTAEGRVTVGGGA